MGTRTACAFAVVATLLAVPGVWCAAAELPAGTYRLDLQLATRAVVPILGHSHSSWQSVALVTIRPGRRGHLWQTHRTCDARIITGFLGVRVHVPPAFTAALAAPSYPIEVRDGRYRADLGIEHIGYRPRGATAPIPRSATDPSIVDWDGDGLPGATLELSVPLIADGEIEIVQRARTILDGVVVAPGRVEGRVLMPLFEQAVIGAHPGIFAGAAGLEPDPERSRFVLARIDDVACSALGVADDVVTAAAHR